MKLCPTCNLANADQNPSCVGCGHRWANIPPPTPPTPQPQPQPAAAILLPPRGWMFVNTPCRFCNQGPVVEQYKSPLSADITPWVLALLSAVSVFAGCLCWLIWLAVPLFLISALTYRGKDFNPLRHCQACGQQWQL